MKIGVICEGHTDRAVISNILKGLKNIDSSQIIPLRPENNKDETDLALLPPDTFSNWPTVKWECEKREKIEKFFLFEGNDFVIIQIDADKSSEFGVQKPVVKDDNYADNVREAIIIKINEWLENNYLENILYAITIEETEAWVLTIYENRDSVRSADPKQRLQYKLNRLGVKLNQTHECFFNISEKFSKRKNFNTGNYLSYNHSLEAFCNEVEKKL
jgi:hypothetical protein